MHSQLHHRPKANRKRFECCKPKKNSDSNTTTTVKFQHAVETREKLRGEAFPPKSSFFKWNNHQRPTQSSTSTTDRCATTNYSPKGTKGEPNNRNWSVSNRERKMLKMAGNFHYHYHFFPLLLCFRSMHAHIRD